MPCDTDVFHSEITSECSDHHTDESPEKDSHHHDEGTTHCACHCHHIQAYFRIGTIEVSSNTQPASHASYYQNRANDSHLHGLFKPPKV